jgi:hypothetical protein
VQSLPLFFFSLGEKYQRCYRPDAEDEPQNSPEISRIAVIMGEETAHNAVEKVNDEGSRDERREGEVAVENPEPGKILKKDFETHNAFLS